MARLPRNISESGQGLVSYAVLPCLVLVGLLGLAAALGWFLAEQFQRPVYEGLGLMLGAVVLGLGIWRWAMLRKKS